MMQIDFSVILVIVLNIEFVNYINFKLYYRKTLRHQISRYLSTCYWLTDFMVILVFCKTYLGTRLTVNNSYFQKAPKYNH